MTSSFSAPFIGPGGVNDLADINLLKQNDSSVFRGKPQKESKWKKVLVVLGVLYHLSGSPISRGGFQSYYSTKNS